MKPLVDVNARYAEPAILDMLNLRYVYKAISVKKMADRLDYDTIIDHFDLYSMAISKFGIDIKRLVGELEEIRNLKPAKLRGIIWGKESDSDDKQWAGLEKFIKVFGKGLVPGPVKKARLPIDEVVNRIKKNKYPKIFGDHSLPSLALFYAHFKLNDELLLSLNLKKYYQLSCIREMERLVKIANELKSKSNNPSENVEDQRSFILVGFGFLTGVLFITKILNLDILSQNYQSYMGRCSQNIRWQRHKELIEEAISIADNKWKEGSNYLHSKMAKHIFEVLSEKYKDDVKSVVPPVPSIQKAIIAVGEKHEKVAGMKGVRYSRVNQEVIMT